MFTILEDRDEDYENLVDNTHSIQHIAHIQVYI